ncbi:MAG TPA: OmpA family protein [Vicinamibacterales bacterium]|nr:OmpA family protein [Vicinamibacterales bacterium]
MNKKNSLCLALFGALGLAQAAVAQDSFDDRWYVVIGGSAVDYDDSRGVEGPAANLGFGRFVSPRWSWDAEIFYANPETERGAELNWSMYSLGLAGRYHFRDEGDTWWPYLSFGGHAQRHEHEISNPFGGQPFDRKGTNLLATAGAGLWADYGRTALRLEGGFRFDFDDDSGRDEDYFSDAVLNLSLMVKMGEAAEPVAPPPPREDTPPPPAPKPCQELDDDGDGVNNCVDRCPDSKPGQAVGQDGCPVPLTIDLRGVNFDFDKSVLRPDAIQILNEAIEILKKYPELRVEVAGHTDSVGTDQYNQRLSERRARAVYDYLTQNGIGANRLAGPNGYGESRPIAPNTTPDGRDNPEGRAKNRRTELNVQN